MSHPVAANFMLPTILETPVKHSAAISRGSGIAPAAAAGAGSAATSANGSLDTSFLNLLVKELQNQDPTAPMDSTAMVGQMISLNQLDQLISINQKTASATPATAPGSQTAAAINAMTGAEAVRAMAPLATGHQAVGTPVQPSGPTGPLQISDLLRSLRGSVASPIQPVVGGPTDPGPIFIDPSAFGPASSTGILGVK